MKIKSKFIILVCCLFLISLLSACGKSEKTPDVGGAVSLVKSYGTLDELVSNAVEIVEINVLNQETFTYKDIPFTISSVTVLSTLKGSVLKGDTIRIVETGGEYNPTDKEGKALPKTTFKLNGIPVLEKGEHDIIMLSKFIGPQIEGEAYTPLGVYQGRFRFDSSGQLIQQAPDKERLKDYKISKIDVFTEIINSKIDN
ncbi:hypothetical protein EHS13_23560 [Paenibacillus psychroresistens]|uniref:Lipoprotein n=1 Tax=Paenibacillus psychroresistens TaxID=1778678 RepID=A0A6B8RQ62_9BACL|nr:hypothetical protein [Paenibacillus psychroresistens]QGQ97653.1 hypothetical protein EHS13_23560 [Paenibacillus psychroresistens]